MADGTTGVMTPRVLVVQPPLRLSRDFIDYPYHCDLAGAQAASVIREAGLGVRLLDAFALPGSTLADLDGDRVRLGAGPDEVLGALGTPDAVVVTLTPFHRPPRRDPLLGALLEGIRARLPEAPVVLADLYQSGQHYVEAPGQGTLASYPEVDALLKYEAEEALVPLLQRLLDGGRPEVPETVVGGEVDGLGALPLPAWDLVDLPARDAFLARVVAGLGRGPWAFPVDGRTLPMVSSRGCPYRCAHCSSNPGRQGKKKTQRRYDAAYLARAVDALVREHGATRLDVLDEMVNVDPGHFEALLAALAPHDLAFDFPNGMRADWVAPAHLDAMAGRVATLSVSAESGDQGVVDRVVGKNLDLARVEETVAGAAARGIPTLVHFIIGMPGETKAQINTTLDWALHLHEAYGAWPGVQFATPLPGTRLADTAAAAAKTPLPVVDDFGPLFQHTPVTTSEDFTAEELRRFKWTFDRRLEAGRGPRKVIMNVTYRCNNRCTFCAVGTRTQLDGSFENQKRILDRYREQGLDLVDFDGGEPTLYPQIIPLVRYAKAIGYQRINVTTNGRRLVYEDFARRLTRSGLTTLLFSVHGHDARTHAQNVGVAEAFEQTCAGVRHAVKHRPLGVELGMNVTVTKSNYAHLPAMAELAWDLGLRWMNLQFLTPFGRATVFVNPDTAAAAKVAMSVIDRWEGKMKFQVINLPFCFMPGYERFMMGDLLKLERHMVFVNNTDVNLFEYLKAQRRHHEECHACPHKIFCGGFYELKASKELPWEFTEDDVNAAI